MRRVEQTIPYARREGLVVKELPDEVLVYDLERHKAHCLNQTAALVWKHCNGQTTVSDIVDILQEESAIFIDEDVIWYALDQLDKARLLNERISRPKNKPKFSRRDAIRRIGIAAAIPLVLSIVAPTALAVGSCLNPGDACTDDNQCCSASCDEMAGICS